MAGGQRAGAAAETSGRWSTGGGTAAAAFARASASRSLAASAMRETARPTAPISPPGAGDGRCSKLPRENSSASRSTRRRGANRIPTIRAATNPKPRTAPPAMRALRPASSIMAWAESVESATPAYPAMRISPLSEIVFPRTGER